MYIYIVRRGVESVISGGAISVSVFPRDGLPNYTCQTTCHEHAIHWHRHTRNTRPRPHTVHGRSFSQWWNCTECRISLPLPVQNEIHNLRMQNGIHHLRMRHLCSDKARTDMYNVLLYVVHTESSLVHCVSHTM